MVAERQLEGKVGTVNWDEFDSPMWDRVQEKCQPFKGVISVDKVLAWDGLGDSAYINDDRWIAFRTKGQNEGFYLVHSTSFD